MGINLTNPVTGHSLNSGLIDWWLTLPGVSYGSTLTGLANSRVGTLTGNANLSGTTPGIGTAPITLDGVNDYLSVPDEATWDFGSSDWSFSSWMNFGDLTHGYFIYHSGNGFSIYYYSAIPRFQVLANDSSALGTISFSPSINTWYYFTYTRSSGTHQNCEPSPGG